MLHSNPSRRQWLTGVGAGGVALLAARSHRPKVPKTSPSSTASTPAPSAARSCRSSKRSTSPPKAGYQAIEPWMRELDDYVKQGGELEDLGKRIRDAGLACESAIGFAEWIVDDDDRRKKGWSRRGATWTWCSRSAASDGRAAGRGHRPDRPVATCEPPSATAPAARSATRSASSPQVEVWGFSKTLSRLGEARAGRHRERPSPGVHPGGRLPPVQGRLRLRAGCGCSAARPCTSST